MPDLDMLIGDTVVASLADYFGHPCRYELSYTASSGDRAAVAVSISEADLRTVAIAVADSVRVNVTATDTSDNIAAQDFYVSVEQPNRAPEVTGRIPDVSASPNRPTLRGRSPASRERRSGPRAAGPQRPSVRTPRSP
ncbi:MAG: hypothetical protein J4F34_07685 [Gemmatimonadetes bacterium]|nr:hypothetical protein [Gemmatimonadota bacterium]